MGRLRGLVRSEERERSESEGLVHGSGGLLGDSGLRTQGVGIENANYGGDNSIVITYSCTMVANVVWP